MDKVTRKNEKWNALVINRLSEKYGLSSYYVRQCLKGYKDSITSNTIRKEYREMDAKVAQALNN